MVSVAASVASRLRRAASAATARASRASLSMHLGRCCGEDSAFSHASTPSVASRSRRIRSASMRAWAAAVASTSAATRSSSAADSSCSASSSASYSASSNCVRTLGGCASIKARARAPSRYTEVRPAAQTVNASNVLCVVSRSDAIADPRSGGKKTSHPPQNLHRVVEPHTPVVDTIVQS